MTLYYAKVINQETGLCEVGIGTNEQFYQSIGMYKLDVEQSDIDSCWYLSEKCPHKTDEEKLQERKEERLQENQNVRDKFLLSGVIYKDILFDSDIEQKLNISVTVNQMSDTDVINWVGMDGVTYLECTKADLLNIGEILIKMTNYVWAIKNPEIKIAIQNAQTIEELDNMEIIYSLDEMIEINISK